jgi:hypothetical protein
MSAEGQTPLIRGGRNMYDELDDMGTGYEEAAEREYDRREEAAIHAVRYPDEAILAFFAPAPLWGATMADDIAALLKR